MWAEGASTNIVDFSLDGGIHSKDDLSSTLPKVGAKCVLRNKKSVSLG